MLDDYSEQLRPKYFSSDGETEAGNDKYTARYI